MDHERVDAASRAGDEQPYVRNLFDRIARRYDLLNHVLSLSLDKSWRRRTIELLRADGPRRVLDVATGTGDLAIAASRLSPIEIRGIDISDEMLDIGREKVARLGLQSLIALDHGQAEELQFADATFDAVTVAFGLRNFSNMQRGLAEMYRVLRPSGVVVILEFSRPRQAFVRRLYGLYFKRILPAIGGIISGSRKAYEYLPNTVEQFPDGEDLLKHLRESGFTGTSYHPVTFGIATIYRAEKPG